MAVPNFGMVEEQEVIDEHTYKLCKFENWSLAQFGSEIPKRNVIFCINIEVVVRKSIKWWCDNLWIIEKHFWITLLLSFYCSLYFLTVKERTNTFQSIEETFSPLNAKKYVFDTLLNITRSLYRLMVQLWLLVNH